MVKSRYAEGPHKGTGVYKKMAKGPSLYSSFESYYSCSGKSLLARRSVSLAHDSPLPLSKADEVIHI
ncbi:hypothetical protein KDAU_26510 [Dictyobacter aurantiacus]|uniref:Uncharacterized protein n=1 Tax=Dictyobacter aurantiacus TaxID=1936993 RepID=A0A401ZEN2_9CHLR|nr:hypothetical protein KDAU_26510 [Dictyobacter aurantiacus]